MPHPLSMTAMPQSWPKRLVWPASCVLLTLIVIVVTRLFSSSQHAAFWHLELIGYAGHIGIWLSSAWLVDRLIRQFAWQGALAQAFGGEVPGLIRGLVALMVYLAAFTCVVGVVFEQDVTGIWATSGVVGLVVGFALQSVILDTFYGLVINLDRPFKSGDWVRLHDSDGVTARVLEVNWRTSRLRTWDNTMVVIPNSELAKQMVTNYNTLSAPIRFHTTVCLDYTIPAERARRVLLAGAKAAMGSRGLMEEPAPVVFVDELNDRGVEYRIEYMLHPWDPLPPMAAEDIVLTSILQHLYKAGLTIAYPKGHEYQEEAPVLNFDPLPLHERSRYLTQMEVFCDLAPDVIDALVTSIQPWTFQASQTLSHPHPSARRIYVLVEGLLQVVMNPRDLNGHAVIVERLQPGQILDEQILETNHDPMTCITAVTDGVIYEMPWDAMRSALADPQPLLHQIDNVIAQRRAKVAHASRQVMVIDDESEAPALPAATLTTRVRAAINRLAIVRRVPSRLLIVDDAAIMRQLIQEVAEEVGLEVVGHAANGEEAVAKYKACNPDLVTMDLVMPGMDGLSALREIVSVDAQAQVLMLSAVNQQEKLVEALELGALDFIVKPFKKEHLQKTLAKIAAGGQRS